MLLSDFDYELPDDLIAQEPSPEREASRMLHVDRASGTIRDDAFLDFPTRLDRGDVLVLNNTKVFPARLFGKSDTGAKVEIFLIRELVDSNWEALARPARRLPVGKRIEFGDELSGTIADKLDDGRVVIKFDSAGEFDEVLARVGRTPLPPYIKRPDDALDSDRARYQTVYARSSGAIAAPTAGLHFTDDVIRNIKSQGTEVVEITLHVGYGTFEPVRVDDLSSHAVLPERYEISGDAAEILNSARSEGRRIVAVGTTTTRALESALNHNEAFVAGPDLADLTITPGYRFRAIGALLTNFHLPQSSLLILVSTFGGHELIMNAYRHAVAERYRFYSYGDCMFIE
jgi:S-adenosylmethionine:tRNA ribosyltransferase-isomerase